ncbi:MAG: sensor histidine kinase [Bacteroidota bacterium]
MALVIGLLWQSGLLLGQEPISVYKPQKKFDKAIDYIKSFKNDSALVVLEELVSELDKRDELDTPLGLHIRYRVAEVLEKDNKDELAIQQLFDLIEWSTEQAQWDVLANTQLSLARLQEKLSRAEPCRSHLLQAKRVIESHGLDSIYPRYCIRTSSYHRLFADQDSARFYAGEVLRTAEPLGLKEDQAVGHLLMGMLEGKTDFPKAIGHFQAAGRCWWQTEDYNGYGASMSNLSTLYLRNGQARKALLYNDSALIAAVKGRENGIEEAHPFYHNYKRRAEIYRLLGQSDSVWHYINKGFELQLADVEQRNYSKVFEIDARYNDDKKAQMIQEQARQIRYERERRWMLIGLLASILIIAVLLGYYNWQLRRANRQKEAQALLTEQANRELSESLKQQKVLQGEVHHRVKNNLQVIISLLELQMEEVDHPQLHNSFETMSNRIYSMSAIHEILYQQEDSLHVDLHEYIENLCLHFSNFSTPERRPVFQLHLQAQHFNLETSMPLGIVLTELLTNSLKHGRLEGKKLQIDIGLERREDGFVLRYKDNGPGFVNGQLQEREGGLGTYLLNSMVRQLNGRVESRNQQGAAYDIFFREKNSK